MTVTTAPEVFLILRQAAEALHVLQVDEANS